MRERCTRKNRDRSRTTAGPRSSIFVEAKVQPSFDLPTVSTNGCASWNVKWILYSRLFFLARSSSHIFHRMNQPSESSEKVGAFRGQRDLWKHVLHFIRFTLETSPRSERRIVRNGYARRSIRVLTRGVSRKSHFRSRVPVLFPRSVFTGWTVSDIRSN